MKLPGKITRKNYGVISPLKIVFKAVHKLYARTAFSTLEIRVSFVKVICLFVKRLQLREHSKVLDGSEN